MHVLSELREMYHLIPHAPRRWVIIRDAGSQRERGEYQLPECLPLAQISVTVTTLCR